LTKEATDGAQAHTICGTPMYYSPELCQRACYDAKTDIWALGCIMFELMTLSHPFEGLSVREVANKVLAYDIGNPNPGGRYREELGRAVTQFMMCPLSARLSAQQLREMPGLFEKQHRLKNQRDATKPTSEAPAPTGLDIAVGKNETQQLLDMLKTAKPNADRDARTYRIALAAIETGRAGMLQDRISGAEAFAATLGAACTQAVMWRVMNHLGLATQTVARPSQQPSAAPVRPRTVQEPQRPAAVAPALPQLPAASPATKFRPGINLPIKKPTRRI